MSSTRELDAYRAEARALGAVLDALEPGDWTLATRCPPMRVRELVAHVIGEAEGITGACEAGPVEEQPEKDRLTWWDYDHEEDAADTLRATDELAATLPEGPLAATFARASADAVAAATAVLTGRGDPVVRTGSGTIKLADYLATRVLEITIHAWDVLDALGLPPGPTPGGLSITGEIMRGLLGADVRDAIADVDLALSGSGRRPLAGREREALGPLAERFPLLA